MQLTLTELDGAINRVALAGRLDAPGADAVGLKFTTAVVSLGRPSIIDLSEVSFVASMGIRMLLSGARGIAQKGGKMVLFGANELVQGVLDDAAIDQLIPIVTTEAQALDALRA